MHELLVEQRSSSKKKKKISSKKGTASLAWLIATIGFFCFLSITQSELPSRKRQKMRLDHAETKTMKLGTFLFLGHSQDQRFNLIKH